MGPFLAGIRVIGGPIPVVIDVLAILAVVWMAIRPLPRGRRLRWGIAVVLSMAGGGALGLLSCWILGDLMNVFGVTLSVPTRAWVAAGFAGIGLAVATIATSRPLRRAGAVASALVFAILAAIGVNAAFGQYPTLASMVGVSSLPDLPDSVLAAQQAKAGSAGDAALQLWKTWHAPAGMPAKGLVGAVTIPATVSHFAARQALVYLPPAALVADPPALPVLIMLSGQPGAPEHVFIAGHLDAVMDAVAAQNNGLAPIVVVPDQLSAPSVNPMCVDSAIGNSATYLTVDVPAWIRANLDVQSVPAAWGVGGFSQGGTCSIQLGAGHPEIFGSVLDVAGELEPKAGSTEDTIKRGFAGDAAAYDAAKPLSLLAAHAPYANTVGIFAVGQRDDKNGPVTQQVAAAAQAAGIRTTVLVSPNTAHDWYTVRYAFQHGVGQLYAQMGLAKPS